jgi:sugar transferase (PEP-CTERM/EpsH1 system associated)
VSDDVADQRPLIAHVIYRLAVGGLENGVVNLVNGLQETQFRHAIVTLAGYTDFRDRIRRTDVEVLSLDKRPGKDPGVYARFHRVLRRLRPRVVHTRNLGTIDLQWIAALAGVPVRIHGEHGWDAADLDGSSPRNLRIRRACRPAIHHYVTMSKDLEHWLDERVGVRPDRITQIYNGVDVARFGPGRAPLPDAPWAADPDPIVIGTVGRLERTKNQGLLLEAFARLVARAPDRSPRLRLLIAGDGPDRAALEAHARALAIADRVWFTGARADVPDVMRALDVFVLPSLNEGISNTLLEAMASARPVIATAVGGNPELIEDAITGFLVAGQQPDALADRIAAYVANPELASAHGRAGRERAVTRFGLPRMLEDYRALYSRLIEARR